MTLPIKSRKATWLLFFIAFLPLNLERPISSYATKFRGSCICGMILDQNALGPSSKKDHKIASIFPLICNWRQTYYDSVGYSWSEAEVGGSLTLLDAQSNVKGPRRTQLSNTEIPCSWEPFRYTISLLLHFSQQSLERGAISGPPSSCSSIFRL